MFSPLKSGQVPAGKKLRISPIVLVLAALILLGVVLVPPILGRLLGTNLSNCWEFFPIPVDAQPTGEVDLRAVAALPNGEAWAVGEQRNDNSSQAITMHFDGSRWQRVELQPLDSKYSGLNAVLAISPDDIWAAGSYHGDSEQHTLIMHWNGNAWNIVPSPSPGADGNVLDAISYVSSGDIWAVGSTVPARSSPQPLLLHWNGKNWTEKPADILEGVAVANGVAAIAANDVWAVGSRGVEGRMLMLHWDGTRWSLVQGTPALELRPLQAAAVAGPSDVWAVGSSPSIKTTTTLTMHWDGKSWVQVPSPNWGTLSDGQLTKPVFENAGFVAVSAASSNDVWAVGSWGDSVYGHSYQRPFALHWDGTVWTVELDAIPFGERASLKAVAAFKGEVWTLGSYVSADSSAETPVSFHRKGVRCPKSP